MVRRRKHGSALAPKETSDPYYSTGGKSSKSYRSSNGNLSLQQEDWEIDTSDVQCALPGAAPAERSPAQLGPCASPASRAGSSCATLQAARC